MEPFRRLVARHRASPSDLVTWAAERSATARDDAQQTWERRLPPEDGLDYYARWLAGRVRAKQDAIVVITGERGKGKSMLALRLGRRVARHLHRTWSTETSLIYTPLALMDFYDRAVEGDRHGEIGWVDEGGRVLYNRDHATRESKAIIKTLTQIREVNAVLFICLPNLAQLDLAARADLACLWIACRRRGLARVHLRDERLRYGPESNYGFAVAPRVPHLTWRTYPPTSPLLLDYLRLKKAALRVSVAEAKAAVAAASTPERGRLGESPPARERRLRGQRERQRRYWRRLHPDASERPSARRP